MFPPTIWVDKRKMIRIKYILIFVIVFSCSKAFCQYNEVGLFLGGSNVIADVGDEKFINPNKLAYGLFYKRNLHNMLSARVDLRASELWANDNRSKIKGRQNRDFAFENNIREVAVGLEYNFLEFNTHKPFEYLFTPYIYAGVGYFWSSDLYYAKGIETKGQWAKERENEKKVGNWTIPFGLGVKTRLGETKIILAAELGARYTLTNNLDGSFPKQENLRFGNKNENDWYVMAGLTVAFTFGEKECQCF